MTYRRVSSLKTAQDFLAYQKELGILLPFDEEVAVGEGAPLGQPYTLKDGFTIGNRFCIQPMEGWDGTTDGRPSELTYRRWENFGRSGAKLIWGGEAVAVSAAARANPNQLMINEQTVEDLVLLRQRLVKAHEEQTGSAEGLLVGLQLTHSGRFSRPVDKKRLEPQILYTHPYLDRHIHLAVNTPVLTDEQIQQVIADTILAAERAHAAGFDFVDIKHCHGYLGHEFLSAYSRPGPYGGSFINRTRYLREIVSGIRARVPALRIGVRLSMFDMPPFSPHPQTGIGTPATTDDYPYGFGLNPHKPLETQLDEPLRFLRLLEDLGIELLNLTAGSPYYTPHVQRPALFPPSDAYQPPEDPLVGVARQVTAAAELKSQFPNLLMVGSAYSYLQEWLANVGQYNVRTRRIDFVGLGRSVLSYPAYAADVLAGRPLARNRICRTFSDCTTAPRSGMVSGCYPLDPLYKARPEAAEVKKLGLTHPAEAE